MRCRSTPRDCVCGARYREFKTGETFATVRRAMRDDPHPETGAWRQKRRNGVLGYWREMKLRLWDYLHGACVEANANPVVFADDASVPF